MMSRSCMTAFVAFAAFFLHGGQVSASEPIRQFQGTGQSGPFKYAVYNEKWLGKKGKAQGRIAITGVLAGEKGDLAIPAILEGFEVYGIDERALASCKEITSITIPATVQSLKPAALTRCPGLKNVYVDDGHPLFASVDGVLFNKEKTTLLAFCQGRDGNYKVPASTKTIGPGAFSLCTNLKSIVIPKSVTDIGGHRGSVFMGCKNLVRVEMPDTVTRIGQKSFQDCSSLKKITIPPKVKEIPFGLFWRCGELTTITLPDGIAKVGNYAFADCTKLTLRAFPKSLTTIGAYAFKNCKSLKGLTLPKGATNIARGAFRGSGLDTDKK